MASVEGESSRTGYGRDGLGLLSAPRPRRLTTGGNGFGPSNKARMSDVPEPAAAALGPEPGSRSAAIIAVTARAVAVVVVAVLALYLVYLLRQPLGWLVLAGFIAVAVSGPVRLFERRMRRGLAIALVYIVVILTPFLIASVLVPPIVDQANNLATNAPRYAH